MKWILLLVIIGLTVFTYTQNQKIEALRQELAAVKADAEALQRRVQTPPRNPFLERQSTMLGSGSAMSGTALDQRPQGNDGPNRGGGRGRH